jgi:hypothetical protein
MPRKYVMTKESFLRRTAPIMRSVNQGRLEHFLSAYKQALAELWQGYEYLHHKAKGFTVESMGEVLLVNIRNGSLRLYDVKTDRAMMGACRKLMIPCTYVSIQRYLMKP